MKPRYLPRRAAIVNLAPFYGITFSTRVPLAVRRRLLEAASRSQPLPAGTVVRRVTLGGRPAERITVGATVRQRTVLYLHGGGYTLCSPATHRSLAAFLARDVGAAVYVPDYRLAPEHPYPAALDDAVAAYRQLHDEVGRPIAIAGDSAGGGLAAATALRLTAQGTHPAALALLSPWTDPTDEGTTGRKRDLVVNVAQGRFGAAAYGAGVDPHDPGFAPMYADRAALAELPPTLVHVAPRELLYEQGLRFVERLRAAGVDVTLRELPGLWHAAHAQAGLVREARAAVEDVGTFLRTNLDRLPAAAHS